MNFSIISALDQNRGIGKNNGLPWHLAADLKHFAATTKGATVIMGRKTWDSLPEKFRPLPGRLNIVVSRGEVAFPREETLRAQSLLAHSLDEALSLAEQHGPERKAFVIGGATLYAEAIQHPACNELILTEIDGTFDCDAFFPPIGPEWKVSESLEKQEEENIHFVFKTYRKN